MNALSEALQGARRIVFFGGAGVSVPSGIPDFRGENGLYAKEYDGLTAEMLLSHSFFCLHPDIFYDFYKKHMLYPNAKPNIVHVRLAEMERTGRVTRRISTACTRKREAETCSNCTAVYTRISAWAAESASGWISS